jgi:hypothetical protein
MAGPQRVAQAQSQPGNLASTPARQQAATLQAAVEPDTVGQIRQFQDTQRELDDVQSVDNTLIPEEAAVDPLDAEFDAAEAAAAEAALAEEEAGPFGAAEPLSSDEAILAADAAESIPQSIDEFKVDASNRIQNTLQRARLSFAGNDKEKVEFLKSRHGADNVRLGDDGEIFFRRKSSSAFIPLDPSTFEIVDDILDFSREAMEEVIALPPAMVGAAAGFASPVPGGTVIGLEAGRATGVMAGMAASDAVAELLLDIPQDPERNKIAERALGGALSLMLPLGGKMSRMAKEAKLARKANIPAEEILTKQTKEVLETADEFKDSILVKKFGDPNSPDISTNILIWQLMPNSPEAREIGKRIGDNPEIQRFLTKQGEAYGDAVETALRSASKHAGGVPADASKEALVSKISNIAKTTRKAEGEAVRELQDKATAMSVRQGKAISNSPAGPELTESLADLNQLLGIEQIAVPANLHTGAKARTMFKPGDITDLMSRLKTPSKAIAEKFMGTMARINSKMQKGVGLEDRKLLLSDVDTAISAASSDPALKRQLQIIASNMRVDRNAKVVTALGEGSVDAERYLDVMGGFQQTMENIDQLGRVLDDPMSRESFAKTIFSKGKGGLADFQAAKSLLKQDHPDTYNQLVASWVDNLLTSKKSRAAGTTTGFKSEGIIKELEGLGKEFTDEIFEGTEWSQKKLVRLAEFGNRIEKTNIKGANPDQITEILSKAAGLLSTIKSTQLRSVAALFKAGTNNGDLLINTLTREGTDKFLGRVPPAERTAVKNKLEAFVEFMRKSRGQVIDKTAEGAGTVLRSEPGQAAARGAIRSKFGRDL